MEDLTKFKMGMEVFLDPPDFSVGTTPSEVVYSEDKMKLIHYLPTVEKTQPVPMLIVYALVNRYYILDLQPDKSVIKKLLEEGFEVYVIDWGYPSGSDRYLTIDDYVNGYINNSVDEIRKRHGQDKITMLGVCQGGAFSVMYSALNPQKVKNLITLVAPIDFENDKGLLHIWAKNLDIDRIVNYYGIVPGDFLNSGFLLTDPIRLIIDKYVGLFEQMVCDPQDEACENKNEETIKNFLRMEKWIFDSPDQAGETLRQFVKDCYQKNLLIKNEMSINGKKIDLKNITMPLLNVMGQFDHLVPNEASKPLNDAVSSSDKEMLIFPTGHIGMFVSRKSQKEVCPSIATWLKPRSTNKDIKGKTMREKMVLTQEKKAQLDIKDWSKKQEEMMRVDKLKLKDKVAIITGAGSGIGRVTAELFAKEGAKVVAADIDTKGIEETVADVEKNGGEAFAARLDVSSSAESKKVVKDTIDKYGKVDILINNAGITQDALISKMTEQQWDKVIDVNLKGPFNCTQAIVEVMINQGSGSIVNTSSIVGLLGNIGQANYAATKAGIVGMTKALAKELGKKGIRVNAVAPGFIMSPMTAAVPEKILDLMREKTPLKRLGEAIDVAYAYAYLASDEASYVNGAVLSVDGGLVI